MNPLLLVSHPIYISTINDEVGISFFYLAGISLVISIIGFLVTIITRLLTKDNSYKSPLKFSLICLLVTGISLLLTAILCGWII